MSADLKTLLKGISMENKKSFLIAFGGIVFGLLFGYLVGSNNAGKSTPELSLSSPTGSCGAESATTALFELNGKVYNENSIPSALKNNLFELRNEGYLREKGVIDEFALIVSLAEKKGMKFDSEHPPRIDQLLPEVKISDSELKDFFNKNKDRLPPNTKLETVKAQLEQYLKSQKIGAVFMAEIEKLKKEGNYRNLIVAPEAPTVNLDISGYPTKGSKESKFILIEASDYTCGHCKTVHPEVKELMRKYGDKIKFVQMNFSLNPSGLSGQLIRGGYCAQEEGDEAFWRYHNAAFEYQVNPQKMEEMTPAKIAKVAGLDLKKFVSCLAGSKATELLNKTNETLHSNGVSSTPSFFLNNKKVVLEGKGLIKAIEEKINL
jgi:protein-disulfide isomerase